MSERRFDLAKMAKLDNPERRKALPPEQLLTLLEIKKNDEILDLGAGTGYFTLPASSLTTGSVFALDVEPQMLEVIRQKTTEQNVTNIQLLQGVIEEIPMEAERIEHVVASFVLHEVEPLSKGFQEIKRVLKPGGRCLCIEWEKKRMEQGPPLEHRIHSDDMKAAFTENGFSIVSTSFPSDSHYVIVAQK